MTTQCVYYRRHGHDKNKTTDTGKQTDRNYRQ